MPDAGDGWFADRPDEDDERAAGVHHMWQPFLQNQGCCFPLPVWFDTEQQCIDFIRSDLVSAPCIDDDPPIDTTVRRPPAAVQEQRP